MSVDIEKIVDSAFSSLQTKQYEKHIETCLFPGAFANPESWLHVKAAISINNQYLKECLKQALAEAIDCR